MSIAKGIQDSIQRSSWVREMFEEGARLKALHGAENVHDFSLGNPILEPPPEFHQELRKLLENPEPGQHRYMHNAGFPETREYVAAQMQGETGLAFEAGDVVMCIGAGGGLNVVLKTLLDPEDEVVALTPFFVEYGFYTKNHGGTFTPVPTTPEFQPDLEVLEAAIGAKTKVVLVNTPNNPTGVVYPQETLDRLGGLLARKEKEVGHSIFLVADDIYRHLIYDGLRNSNVFLSHRNAILVNSHSKDLGLPGERIGYIAVHPEMEARSEVQAGLVLCNRILGFVNAPALMQKVLPRIGKATVDVSVYEDLRNRFLTLLEDCGFETVRPQGGFFLFPKAPEPDDVAFVRRAQQENVLLVPGTGFGMPGYFRISFCCTPDAIDRARPAFEQLARHYGLR